MISVQGKLGWRVYAVGLLLAIATIGSILFAFPRKSQKQAILRVGVDDSPPFYLLEPNGIRGLAIDVFNEAARRQGIQVQWVRVVNTRLDEALRSRLVDAWPLVGSTPERQRDFHLSEPWLDSDYVIVSTQASPVRRPADAAGRPVAHARLTLVTRLAEMQFPSSKRIILPTRQDAINAMCAGEAAAALMESRVLDRMLMHRSISCQNTDLAITRLPGGSIPLAIAAVPEAAATVDRLRAEIDRLASEGFLDDRLAEWAPFSAQGTRSLFNLMATERRSQRYRIWSLTLIGVVVLLIGQFYRSHRMRRRAERAEADLRETEQRFQLYMDHSPVLAFMKDGSGRMLYVNRSYAKVFGIQNTEYYQKDDFDLWPAHIAGELRSNDLSVLKSGKARELLESVPFPDGGMRQLLVVKFPFTDSNGRTLLGGIALDITERARADQDRERLLAQRTALLASAGNAIFGIDLDGRCTFMNPRAAELLGYSVADCMGRNMHELIQSKHADGAVFPQTLSHMQRICQQGGDIRVEDEVFWRKDGTTFAVGYHARAVLVEGRIEGAIVTFADITLRKQTEARLQAEAKTDSLTGLANRRSFEDQLRTAVHVARLEGTPLSIALCDIDQFKRVNDEFGHPAGDEVLVMFAELLRGGIRNSDVVARIGGDEFAVVFTQSNVSEAKASMDRIRQRLETICFGLNLDRPFAVTASFGVAEFRMQADPRELFAEADQALYDAKRSGRNQTVMYRRTEQNIKRRAAGTS